MAYETYDSRQIDISGVHNRRKNRLNKKSSENELIDQKVNEFQPAQEQSLPESSSGDSGAADAASSGLMMTGNPYAIGAGVGLQVLSMRQKRKQKEQELGAKMKLDRINRQQRALSNLMQVSQGLSI